MALTNKVYVGDLPDTVEEDEIKQVFEPFGEVTEVELKSTFAFVHMANSNEAEEAIAKLNNTELSGRLIRVERPRPRRGGFRGGQRGGGAGGGGGGGDNCFNCGLPGHWQRECRKGRNGGGGPGGGGGGGFSGRGSGFGGSGGFGGNNGGGFGGGGYQQGGGFSGGRFDGAPRGRGVHGGGGGGGFGGRGGRGRGNCFICNSPEHWSRECPDNQNAQQKY